MPAATHQCLCLDGERGVMDRVQSRADTVVHVGGRIDEFGHPMRVFGLAAHRRAVLAIERDVEDRPHLALHRKALAHARLDARVVVADRKPWREVFGAEQRLARTQARALRRSTRLAWPRRGAGR